MKKLMIACMFSMMTLISGTANAATAFKTGENRMTNWKECYYSYLNNQYVVTVNTYEMCPLSIQV